MEFVHRLIRKRSAFFFNDSLYQSDGEKLVKLKAEDNSGFWKEHIKVVIVGREHYVENTVTYPINDVIEVRNILKNELDKNTIVGNITPQGDSTRVETYQLDKSCTDYLAGRFNIWIPEVLVLGDSIDDALSLVSRAQNVVYFVKHGNQIVSTVAQGVFADPEYFLLSLGVSSPGRRDVSEAEYITNVETNLRNLPPNLIKNILFAQGHMLTASLSLPWKYILAGVATGFLLALSIDFGQLYLRNMQLDAKISNVDIKSLVSARNRLQQKLDTFENFSTNKVSENKDLVLWKVLGDIMQEQLTIIRFRSLSGGVSVRLESQIATEGLERIKDMSLVSEASFAAAVQNSRGKQRYWVDIVFADSPQGITDNE